MTKRFRLDGVEYDFDALSAVGIALVERISFVQDKIQMLVNEQALLNKAKNAYIADLKSEVALGQNGLDIGSLFSDD